MVLIDLGEAETEDRFHTELALLLGDTPITRPATTQQLQVTDGGWLDALRPVIPDGHAAVWLDPDPSRCRASIAVLSNTRAEVQVVEVPAGDGAEALLALSVREVLALINAAPEPVEPPAPESTPEPPPPVVPPEPSPTARMRPRVGASVVAPQNGAVRGGGVVMANWKLRPNLSTGIRLGVQAGANGVWFQPGVHIARGRFTIGGQAAVVSHPWGVMVRPGVRLGMLLPVSESHIPGVSLTWLPVRDIVYGDGGVVYDSGRLELTLEYTWGRSDG